MEKEKKIELIRESIKQNKYPLKYEGCINYYGGNCYRYAIGSKYKESPHEKDYIYNLGAMSGTAPPTSIRTAEKAFRADMEVLGIKVKKSDKKAAISENEWKLALFYDDYDKYSHDFHFVRQDNDGNWSNQEFINGPIGRVMGPIEDCTGLTLVGFFILSLKNN